MMRLAPASLLAAFGLLAFGCGKVVPHPTAMGPPGAVPSAGGASSTTALAATSPPADASRAPARALFRLAWRRQTRPFHKALAISPTGHLAVLASRQLSLYRLATGERLAATDVCFAFPSALGLVSSTRAALVCEDAIGLFSVPELGYQGHKELPDKARTAAFGGEVAAVGFDRGPVRLYDTADWRQVGEVALAERASALGLSADGNRLAIGLESGELVLLDRALGRQRRIAVAPGFAVQALAFASAGDELVAAAGPASMLWRASAPETVTPLPLVRGMRVARWVDGREIATAGDDGLLLLALDRPSTESIGEGWGGHDAVGLASLPGQGVVCAAAHEGLLECFSRGALPATAELPLLAEPGGMGARPMTGRVQLASGDRLQIKAYPGTTLPPVGAQVVVQQYVERTVGGYEQVGWERVSDAVVERIDQDVVHLRLGTSAATRWPNGHARQGPLAYDTAVRVEWSPP